VIEDIDQCLFGSFKFDIRIYTYVTCLTPTDFAVGSSLICLAMLQPTLRSTLPVDIPTDYPCLSILQLTIRFAVSSDTPTVPTTRSTDDPSILCTMFADITTDYPPLYPACRYDN
jgi:hypothetical protein